eukprot:4231512-Pyramimonas_sp.AAC.1
MASSSDATSRSYLWAASVISSTETASAESIVVEYPFGGTSRETSTDSSGTTVGEECTEST